MHCIYNKVSTEGYIKLICIYTFSTIKFGDVNLTHWDM